ncbi:MAG TPA: tetratricopeptide repeat protein [Terriglobales bacterium]
MRSPLLLLVLAFASLNTPPASSQEVRVPLPKKSKYTPVQELNRDGVKALEKHDVAKAKRLFYKAYLLDPNDPFTLNNLGYISEIEGDMERARRYYDQAQANTAEAVIDRSTERKLEGKVVAKVAGQVGTEEMHLNQLNSEAVRLLNQDRAPEADLILQQALKINPNNPFTLNNMGFAKEKEGELEQAIRNYQRAANTHSTELIVVTENKDWRGKTISEVADRNALNASLQLGKAGALDARVARLNLQGVSAMNRNDRATARADFEQAFKLDPQNSFTINNMGFLAELDGDKETAQTYYEQAQAAVRNREKVAVATRAEVEGREMRHVAEQSSTLVESTLDAQAEAKRQSSTRPTLKTRDKPAPGSKPAPTPQPATRQDQSHPGTVYTPPEFRKPHDQSPNSPAQPSPQPDDTQKPPN